MSLCIFIGFDSSLLPFLSQIGIQQHSCTHLKRCLCQAGTALLDQGSAQLLNLCLTRNCSFQTNHDYCHCLPLQPTSSYPFCSSLTTSFHLLHIHNIFTRPEMNRAINISHVNSADNDQKLIFFLPAFSQPALGS